MCSKRVAPSQAGHATLRRWQPVRVSTTLGVVGFSLIGLSTLAACDDYNDRNYGSSRGFGPDRRGDDDGSRRGRRSHRDRDRDRPDAALAADAGLDAGAPADASLLDAGAGASSNVDAGSEASAAGAADSGAGAVDSTILALSDGQILSVADALLAGEIEQARAAQPLLVDTEVLAFAEQMAAEREAARSTLASLATAIDIAAEPSSVADEVLAENTSALEQLAGPDAGAIDADFVSSREVVHARTLERLGELGAAADAPALRAQLLVLQALEQSALEQARDLSASL